MARISLFLLVVACLGILQGAWGKRRLYRKARSMDAVSCGDFGGVLFNDICYIIGEDLGTWEEARETCMNDFDGDLAVISKKAAYDYIMEMLDFELMDGTSAWIGLSDIDTEGLFEWVDGYVDYEERGDYWDIFWEWSDDSLGEYPNKDCVLIDKDTGKVKESDCNERHFYICEIITYPDEWEMEQMNEEIEWENNLVETMSNSSVMKDMEEYNGADLFELDIKLNKEEEEIFESGGDPSSATGAFDFQGSTPSNEELAMIKDMIDEHGIDDWDPASREFESRRKRSALGTVYGITIKTWPGGVVPFEFNPFYPDNGKPFVKEAMAMIEKSSCIRFKPRTTESKYMTIGNAEPRSCHSNSVGYPSAWYETTRDMNFGWCWNKVESIVHEFFHALGFWHEMSRPDRDDYIEIVKKNIQPGRANMFQFEKFEKSTMSGYPYDYFSIMHYPLNAMAIDESKYTMRPKKLDVKLYQKVGNAKLPTKLDWFELNSIYKCDPKYMKLISDRKDKAVEVETGKWSPCSVTCGIGARTKTTTLCKNGRCLWQMETGRCYMPPCPKPGVEIPKVRTGGGAPIVSLDYTSGGCWNDDRFPSSLASLEGNSKFLTGDFKTRTDNIQRCANAAKEKGSKTFALKFGGKCLVVPSNAKDKNVYKANGPSNDCKKGLGAVSAISVYHLETADVKGEWGTWSAYGSCSKTCGGGLQTRTRQCDNPKPKGSGGQCTGSKTGTGKCATGKCPVDGGWGGWGPWSTDTCSDWGYRFRQRKCDNPKPQNGGRQCLSGVNLVQVSFC